MANDAWLSSGSTYTDRSYREDAMNTTKYDEEGRVIQTNPLFENFDFLGNNFMWYQVKDYPGQMMSQPGMDPVEFQFDTWRELIPETHQMLLDRWEGAHGKEASWYAVYLQNMIEYAKTGVWEATYGPTLEDFIEYAEGGQFVPMAEYIWSTDPYQQMNAAAIYQSIENTKAAEATSQEVVEQYEQTIADLESTIAENEETALAEYEEAQQQVYLDERDRLYSKWQSAVTSSQSDVSSVLTSQDSAMALKGLLAPRSVDTEKALISNRIADYITQDEYDKLQELGAEYGMPGDLLYELGESGTFSGYL